MLGMTVRAVIALVHALPLEWAARMGRCLGWFAWIVDRRHRRVALANLEAALGVELGPEGVRRVARANFLNLGENYVCAIRTAVMSDAELGDRLEWVGAAESVPGDGRSLVMAVGHFGNFELYARFGRFAPHARAATTYRALRQPSLNAAMQSLRVQSGMEFFERTRDARRLRDALAGGTVMLGLLADQHAGDKGLWLPFLGRGCSTTAAPAVYALRFDTVLRTAACFRTGLARWRIEMGPEIPTKEPDGTPREPAAIMTDANRALEAVVRRDPSNWFWVHRRWKPASTRQRNLPKGSASDPDAD